MPLRCRGSRALLVVTFTSVLVAGVSGQRRPPIDETKAVPLGLSAGDIANLVTTPSNPSVLYAIGAAGGVFRSGDGAATWSRRSRGLPDLNVLSVYVHPQLPDTVWVGTLSGGIAKTTDGGLTWAPKNAGLPNFSGFIPAVNDIAGDPTDGAVLAIATDRGAHRSSSGGDSWTASGLSNRALKQMEVAFSNGSVLYTSDSFAVFRSNDRGLTWNGVLTNTLGRTFGSLSVDPTNPDTAFVGGSALSKTANGGVSWSTVPACVGTTAVSDVLFDRHTPNRLFAACGSSATGVRESTNGGTTWADAGLLPAHPRRLARGLDLVYAATDEGTFVSDSAVRTWVLAKGQAAGSVTRVAAVGKDAVFVDGPAGRRINLQTLSDAAALPKRFAVLPSDIEFVQVMHVIPPDPGAAAGSFPGTLVAEGSHAFFSPPGATAGAWRDVSAGIPAGFVIQAIDSTVADPTVLHMAGGYSNVTNTSANVFTLDTKDPVMTWKPLPARAPSFLLDVYRSPRDPNFFYTASFEGISKSFDGGTSWQPITGLPSGTVVYGLLVDPANDNIIWVNVGFTIKRSTNGGQTFAEPVRPDGFKDLVSLTADPRIPMSCSSDRPAGDSSSRPMPARPGRGRRCRSTTSRCSTSTSAPAGRRRSARAAGSWGSLRPSGLRPPSRRIRRARAARSAGAPPSAARHRAPRRCCSRGRYRSGASGRMCRSRT